MKSEQGSSANFFFAAAVTAWQSGEVLDLTTEDFAARELTFSTGDPAELSFELDEGFAAGAEEAWELLLPPALELSLPEFELLPPAFPLFDVELELFELAFELFPPEFELLCDD